MGKIAAYNVVGVTGKVDLSARKITGVAIATIGRASGTSGVEVDAETLKQIASFGKIPVRSRIDHPEDTRNPDKVRVSGDLNTLVGSFENFRVEDNKVLADFFAVPEAANPKSTQLLHLAGDERAAKVFGVSMVCLQIIQKNKIRVEELYSIDWVDVPALNPNGVFSAADKGDKPMKVQYDADKKCYFVEVDGKREDLEMPEKEKKEEAAKNAATAGDDDATKKDVTKMSAGDIATARPDAAKQLRDEGQAAERKYSGEFDTAMTAAGIAGDARTEFRTKYYGRDLATVKEFAVLAAGNRTKPVGESGADNAGETGKKPVEIPADVAKQFSVTPRSFKARFGVNTEDVNSDEYKKGLAKYAAGMAEVKTMKVTGQ